MAGESKIRNECLSSKHMFLQAAVRVTLMVDFPCTNIDEAITGTLYTKRYRGKTSDAVTFALNHTNTCFN